MNQIRELRFNLALIARETVDTQLTSPSLFGDISRPVSRLPKPNRAPP